MYIEHKVVSHSSYQEFLDKLVAGRGSDAERFCDLVESFTDLELCEDGEKRIIRKYLRGCRIIDKEDAKTIIYEILKRRTTAKAKRFIEILKPLRRFTYVGDMARRHTLFYIFYDDIECEYVIFDRIDDGIFSYTYLFNRISSVRCDAYTVGIINGNRRQLTLLETTLPRNYKCPFSNLREYGILGL